MTDVTVTSFDPGDSKPNRNLRETKLVLLVQLKCGPQASSSLGVLIRRPDRLHAESVFPTLILEVRSLHYPALNFTPKDTATGLENNNICDSRFNPDRRLPCMRILDTHVLYPALPVAIRHQIKYSGTPRLLERNTDCRNALGLNLRG